MGVRVEWLSARHLMGWKGWSLHTSQLVVTPSTRINCLRVPWCAVNQMSGGRPSRQDDNELRHGPHSVDNRGDIVTYTDCCQQLCIVRLVATTLRRGRRGSFESLLTAAIPSLKAGGGEGGYYWSPQMGGHRDDT